jgi:UDP-N-acetylglucosamine acyltransferase
MKQVTVVREVHSSARVAPDAVIGPYCVVGPNVTIGPRTVLVRRVSVAGSTTIGSQNVFEEGCVLGSDPQDLKYKGASTLLVIGHRNRFGRCATAHIGTEVGGFVTRIGHDNVIMDGAHIAHDCFVDDRTTLGRQVMLAGHVHVQTGAVLEDMGGAHHFVTVGRYARVGKRTPIRRDVPPYTHFYADGPEDTPAVHGVHDAGIKAAGLDGEDEKELRHALRELFSDEAALQTRIEQLVSLGVEGQAAALCEFCQRSLQGVYGRYRELYRGKTPPEAEPHLPPELRASVRRP